MPAFRLTFGGQYRSAEFGGEPHPVGGHSFVHTDGWWTIVATDYDAARELAVEMLGSRWSNLYEARDAGTDWSLFPRGELLRIVHPNMRGQAEHLLVGDMPPGTYVDCLDGEATVGGRLLVTVWGDGTGELAWRLEDDDRWSAPSRLELAPGQP